ncbi:MAG: DUF72 domain-containing protein [Armatimonadetes bacterium]|nr:DUF72 domain-containing protein [Armatimonadota bacterium]
MAEVLVGCCGWAGRQADYFRDFKVIEIQQTFYKPVQPQTLQRWREEAPDDFVFCIKAWQAITHPASSPTYRKGNIQLPPGRAEEFGFFRPTEAVLEGWERTLEAARLLRAAVVVFQCPASFKPTDENKQNLLGFFRSIGPQEFLLAWEPRGDWSDAEIFGLCQQAGLIHVVDPFVRSPVTSGPVYYRLHGIGGYRYSYTDDDLRRLRGAVPADRPCFVLFNNVDMRRDAMRFIELLRAG